jgi:hypothetical protein
MATSFMVMKLHPVPCERHRGFQALEWNGVVEVITAGLEVRHRRSGLLLRRSWCRYRNSTRTKFLDAGCPPDYGEERAVVRVFADPNRKALGRFNDWDLAAGSFARNFEFVVQVAE